MPPLKRLLTGAVDGEAHRTTLLTGSRRVSLDGKSGGKWAMEMGDEDGDENGGWGMRMEDGDETARRRGTVGDGLV